EVSQNRPCNDVCLSSVPTYESCQSPPTGCSDMRATLLASLVVLSATAANAAPIVDADFSQVSDDGSGYPSIPGWNQSSQYAAAFSQGGTSWLDLNVQDNYLVHPQPTISQTLSSRWVAG